MRAQVGLADLLRALHLHRDRGGVDVLPLEGGTHDGLRYRKQPESAPVQSADTVELQGRRRDPPPADAPPPRLSARSALRMPEVWTAERLTPAIDGSGARDASAERQQSSPLPAEELFRKHPRQVGYEDLVPHPRLAQPLATRLRQPRPGAVDVPALVRAASRQRWPRTLPRSRRLAWPHTLVVVLDQSDALYPYWEDMRRLSGWLRARVPKAQLRICMLRNGPLGAWRPSPWWPQSEDDATRPHPRPGHTYLLLSDLGLLRPEDNACRAWKAWLNRAAACRADCVALAPVPAEWVPHTFAAHVCLLRWSPDSRAQPERGRPAEAAADARAQPAEALHQLLACLGATLRMDPPLLRALRQHGSCPNDASLEGRLWAHPDVRAYHFATLREGPRRHSQTAASVIGPALSSVVHAEVARHHRHWPFVWRLEEQLRQIASTPEPAQALLDDTRLALHSFSAAIPGAQAAREKLAATARHILHRAHDRARVHLHSELDALANAIGHPTGPRRPWCLLQRGEDLYIAPAGDARPAGPGVVLCGDIGQAAVGELVRIAQPQRLPAYQALPAEGILRLPTLLPGSVVTLGGVEAELRRLRRTRGIWGWRQGDEDVIEKLDLPWSKDLSFPDEGLRRGFALLPSQNGGEVRVGVDRDNYGVFLELAPTTLVAKNYLSDFSFPWPLRFRYLEPATFLQGSPEGTGHPDERPQHPVTLTRGLWLAETPCTQALWLAVMGKNPSQFKQARDKPPHAVENVSWEDATTFLLMLQPLLPPGCEAVLPTESQWEYACRAGTQTEYWWGNNAEDVRANWKGQHHGTIPVDSYPPNPWGLFDMHGNVWEWCRDGKRDYAADPARDPEGSGASELRVARGGSWFNYPSGARASFRDSGRRGLASRTRGFRFALMPSRGPEAPAAEQPAERADDDIANQRNR